MAISLEELERIAGKLVTFIGENKIASLYDLDHLLGKRFALDCREGISIELCPSNKGTKAYTLSYLIEGAGVPIEARINPRLNYSKILIKSEKKLVGYSEFARDAFGNHVQCKDIDGYDFREVYKELRSLSVLTR